jgi:hypothetical protein
MPDGPRDDEEQLPLQLPQASDTSVDVSAGLVSAGLVSAGLEAALAEVLTLPAHGEVLPDARGGGRWLRVTWHHEVDVVVLSQWREDTCVGTVRLARSDVPLLVQTLVEGLADDSGTPGRRRRPTS